MIRGAWWASPWGGKESDTTERLTYTQVDMQVYLTTLQSGPIVLQNISGNCLWKDWLGKFTSVEKREVEAMVGLN